MTTSLRILRSTRSCCSINRFPHVSLRTFSSGQGTTPYIDEWFASIVKPQSFYDDLSEKQNKLRCYFYNVDLQGRLFLEETLPKNIATSLKDNRFLDFFWQRLRIVTPRDAELLKERELNQLVKALQDYPFVSPCGRNELNFVRPAATPIVFHTLQQTHPSVGEQQNHEQQNRHELVYAGTMTQPLDITKLAVSRETGRLYHQVTAHSLQGPKARRRRSFVKDESSGDDDATNDDYDMELLLKGLQTADQQQFSKPNQKASNYQYGLIRSSVAVALSEHIVHSCNSSGDSEEHGDSKDSGLSFVDLDDGSTVTPLPWLPEQAEPGPWAMPFVEGSE